MTPVLIELSNGWVYFYQSAMEFIIGVLFFFFSLIFLSIGERYFKPYKYLIERLNRLNLEKNKYETAYANLKSKSKIHSFHFFYTYAGFISFLAFIGFTISSIFTIGQYSIPNNFYNFKTVIMNVEKRYEINSKDFEIKYFNDKYIFIKHYLLEKEKRDAIKIANDTLKRGNKISIPTKILVIKSDLFFNAETQ